MDIDVLIEAAKNYVVTDEVIEAFNLRMKAAEEKFEIDAKLREVTIEWLNKPFSSL